MLNNQNNKLYNYNNKLDYQLKNESQVNAQDISKCISYDISKGISKNKNNFFQVNKMTQLNQVNIQMMEDVTADKVNFSKYSNIKTTIDEIMPQGLSYGDNTPNPKGGESWQFLIPNGTNNIVTKQSYVQYTMKFHLIIRKNGIYKMGNGFWYCQDEETPATDSTPELFKGSIAAKKHYIYNSPMMSTCIIKESQVIYQNINQIDQELNLQTALWQPQFEQDQLNKMNDTFFDADDVIVIDARQAVINKILKLDSNTTDSETAPEQYHYTFYKTFKIPLAFCNQFFDQDVIPTAYLQNNIQLRMKLQEYSYAKIFTVEDSKDLKEQIAFNKVDLVDVKIVLERKENDQLRNDMSQLPQVTHMTQRTDIQALATQSTTTGIINQIVSLPHQSVNQLIFFINTPDQNEIESLNLKQKFTLHKPSQLIAIMNGKATAELRSNFLGDVQVFLSGKGIWQNRIMNLAQIVQSNYNSFGCLNSYREGSNKAFQTNEWLRKYAIFSINLEAFSQLEGITDCALDGVDTNKLQISLQQRLYSYMAESFEPKPYQKPTAGDILEINDQYNLYIQQSYDNLVTFKPGYSGSNQTDAISQVAFQQ